MISEPYIRKKGKKFIIEQKVEGKTKYLKTLPNAKTLLELLKSEAFDEKDVKASQNDIKNAINNNEKFAQSLLNEVSKNDAFNNDLIKQAKKAQDDIMRGLLK